ncbi:MAG: CPBP family glutamic-type intramembrane protease [Thermoanaerobaculia bacterium]
MRRPGGASPTAPGDPTEPWPTAVPAWPASAGGWVRLTIVLAALFALFHGIAEGLGSDRGQHGPLIATVVVVAVLGADRRLSGEPLARCLQGLGLGAPRLRGLGTAAALCLLLLASVPLLFRSAGAEPTLLPGWALLLPGLFAQAGIAEEVLFRGFLFRRLRRGRSFRRAAGLAAIPFVLVHLLLLATLAPPVALASIALAAAISFPLAHLYELGGGTIWAPALLHFVVQGTVKVLDLDGVPPTVPVLWMLASATVPWAAFLVRRRPLPA